MTAASMHHLGAGSSLEHICADRAAVQAFEDSLARLFVRNDKVPRAQDEAAERVDLWPYVVLSQKFTSAVQPCRGALQRTSALQCSAMPCSGYAVLLMQRCS